MVVSDNAAKDVLYYCNFEEGSDDFYVESHQNAKSLVSSSMVVKQ